jgi:transcriptional regulator with XRE-family HTH domain
LAKYGQFGQSLAQLRVRGGYKTRTQLAEKIGATISSYSRWESGEGRPREAVLASLCAVLKPDDPDALYRLCGYFDDSSARNHVRTATNAQGRARPVKPVPGYIEAGKLLARLRVQAGFEKQKDLADANGIAQQTVSRWESGISRPRTGELEKLVVLLKPESPDELYRLCGYFAPETNTERGATESGSPGNLSLSDTRLLMMWAEHNRARGIAGARELGWELNERGESVVSTWRPARYLGLCLQVEKQVEASLGIGARLDIAVLTRGFGIRVPTLVWMPPERWEGADESQPLSSAPELCVEIVTDSLVPELLGRRVSAYLASGVREVAIVRVTGEASFWTDTGRADTSALGVSF